MDLTLKDIANRHKEWIKIAIYVGASSENAEDFVQDMYIKLSEMERKQGSLNRMQNYSGGVNTVYVFKILTNLVIDSKRKRKLDTTPIQPHMEMLDSPNDEEKYYSELIQIVYKEIDNMHLYDQMLLELHFVYGMSMRQIEKKTNIPTHSIFNTLKNAKQKIRQKGTERFNQYCEERNNNETDTWTGGRNQSNNESHGD
jgi:RNA polymerase sigma factor (sigma-70 family)